MKLYIVYSFNFESSDIQVFGVYSNKKECNKVIKQAKKSFKEEFGFENEAEEYYTIERELDAPPILDE